MIVNLDINKKGEILLGFCVDNIEYNDDGSQMSLNKKTLYSDSIRAVIKGGERAPLSFLITKKEKSKGGKIIMLIKRGANLGVSLLVLFLLVGCAGGGITDPDEMGIHAITDSIKTAIENKDVDMFMSNISLDYDDPEEEHMRVYIIWHKI